MPLLWVLIGIVVLFSIGRLPAFRAQAVEVSGTDNKEVIKAINELKGSSFFSQRLEHKIDQIRLNWPTIATLECRRGIPGTLKCRVALRQGAVVWKVGDKQYLVDEDGFVFGQPSGTLPLPTVEDKSGAPVKLGQAVASTQTVSNFIELSQLLTTNHLQLGQLYIVDTLYQCGAVLTGSTDDSLPFAKSSPISVLFSFDRPLKGQVATLVQTLKDKHDQITDHVDLRVAGYAYIQ